MPRRLIRNSGAIRWCQVCGKQLEKGQRKYCSSACMKWWNNQKFHRLGALTRHEQIIWAAGFFDGEGSVNVNRLASGGYNLRVSISQSKSDATTKLFQELFGGGTSVTPPRGNRAASYTWTISGAKAISVLRQMWHYLIVKRPQAEVAEEWAKLGPISRNPVLREKRLARQEELRLALLELNKRGPQ